jgi:hypothetical protein
MTVRFSSTLVTGGHDFRIHAANYIPIVIGFGWRGII